MPEHLNRQLLQRNPGLQNEKCAIFSCSGCLLWHSPGWGATVSREVLGRRWLEFVHNPDIDAVLFYLSRSELAVCSFRVCVTNNSPAVLVTWNKTLHHDLVIIIGDFSLLLPFLPAPRTLV